MSFVLTVLEQRWEKFATYFVFINVHKELLFASTHFLVNSFKRQIKKMDLESFLLEKCSTGCFLCYS